MSHTGVTIHHRLILTYLNRKRKTLHRSPESSPLTITSHTRQSAARDARSATCGLSSDVRRYLRSSKHYGMRDTGQRIINPLLRPANHLASALIQRRTIDAMLTLSLANSVDCSVGKLSLGGFSPPAGHHRVPAPPAATPPPRLSSLAGRIAHVT